MGRIGSLLGIAIVGFAWTAHAAPPVEDEGSATNAAVDAPWEDVMAGLRWGMSKAAVLEHVSAQIRERYKPLIREARGIVEEDRLYQRMEAEIRRVRDSFVVFDGKVTGWDVSFVGDEFRHGSREAMLVVQEPHARSFYFFIANRLWKWFKALDEDATRGQRFEGFGAALEARFGAAAAREGAPVEGARPQRWLEWADPNTRLRALQVGAQFCLVFESNRVLERLAELRKDAIQRGRQRHEMLESVLLEGSSRDFVVEDQDDSVAARVADQLRRKAAK